MELPEEGLYTYTQTLTASHLESALSNLIEARNLSRQGDDKFLLIKVRHKVVSCIIHGYCALEAALNRAGHQMFNDTENRNYISLDLRSVELDLLIKSWPRSLPPVDKLRFIISHFAKGPIPRLENELRELGNLRNWLVHGYIYQTTLLLSQEDQTNFDILDREDSVDWAKVFPNTKFQAIDRLEYADGITAIRVVFESLRLLAEATDEIFSFSDFQTGEDRTVMIHEFTKVPELMSKHLDHQEA